MCAHTWRNIVKQIDRETDPTKIAELSKELNDAMIAEERENVKHRLGIAPQPVPHDLMKPSGSGGDDLSGH